MMKGVIVKSFVNSYHYLYQDARHLHELAKRTHTFERTQYCRTALLLYIVAFEGLVNRAMDEFLRREARDYFVERGKSFSLEDKLVALSIFSDPEKPRSLSKGSYPWSHLLELIRIRNDLVHPKHDRAVYYRMISTRSFEPLEWKSIPKGLEISESDLVYRQTRIPKDPYNLLPDDVDRAQKVINDSVVSLDGILDGRLKNEDWLTKDTMSIIFPVGATLRDIPAE